MNVIMELITKKSANVIAEIGGIILMSNLSEKNQARIKERTDWYLKEYSAAIDRIIRLLQLGLINKKGDLSDQFAEELYNLVEKVYKKGMQEGAANQEEHDKADFLAWLYEVRGRNVMFDLDFEEIVSKKIKELEHGN